MRGLEVQAECGSRSADVAVGRPELVQRFDASPEQAAAWNALGSRSGSPMQSYSWALACVETLIQPDDLQVVAVGDPTRPTAIAPLVRRRRGMPRLELLGVDEIHEPMDFLYADPAALERLAECLIHMGLPLFLKRIPARSPAVAALRKAYRGHGLVLCRPVAGCPYIPLTGDWTRPEERLTARRRGDLQRARRLAEQIGRTSFAVRSPTPFELAPLLEEAFRVEAAGWRGRQGTAIRCDPVRGPFYRRYASLACQEGILRICFLRIGGRVAAMQLGVECAGRFWLLKIGYDEAFARCSPGTLLLVETVRWAAERGLLSYELLGSTEPWTRPWTAHAHECLLLAAYPTGWQGMVALTYDIWSSAARRVARVARGRRE
jgi:CelD/BcsL family acetyltransferase involved in cellulose biosynthesis